MAVNAIKIPKKKKEGEERRGEGRGERGGERRPKPCWICASVKVFFSICQSILEILFYADILYNVICVY